MRPSARHPGRDPVAAALDRAPRVQTLTPEQRAELDRILEDVQAGRMDLVAHEDVPRWLEEQARRDPAG